MDSERLSDALQAIRSQGGQMRRCLDTEGRLLAAIKHASVMLGELRTSVHSPKDYYELYVACFDFLTQLGSYLKEDHKTHHLGDIYEIVQYTGNIVPRLYLMITVGSAYLSVPDAPVRDILKDMLEMCRGVQHPLKGLFLRYYLAQATRDYLPTAVDPAHAAAGTLSDTIRFVITNFVEMNKLWVRIQHQGHSSQRAKRKQERQEVKTIVGSNLVRLAQLDGITLDIFRTKVLPAILEQIVQSHDVLAQEYLLDVICQAFPAEYHLGTLDQYLGVITDLSPQASVKDIITLSMDRILQLSESLDLSGKVKQLQKEEGSPAAEASSSQLLRERESREGNAAEDPGEMTQEELAMRHEPAESPASKKDGDATEADEGADAADADSDKLKSDSQAGHPDELEDAEPNNAEPKDAAPNDREPNDAEPNDREPKDTETKDAEPKDTGPKDTEPKTSDEPNDSETFDARDQHAVVSELARAYSKYWDTVRGMNDRLNTTDRAFIVQKLARLAYLLDQADLHQIDQLMEFVEKDREGGEEQITLLLQSLLSYLPLLSLITFGSFQRLLSQLDREMQQLVADRILKMVLDRNTCISDQNIAKQIFGLFGVMTTAGDVESLQLAELVFLLEVKDLHNGYALLQLAYKSLRDGGPTVIQQTYPVIVTSTIRLIRANLESDIAFLFKFIGRTTNDLVTRGQAPQKAARLYAMAAAVADQIGAEAASYEFYAQAFTLYEESIPDSKDQFELLCILTSTLQKSRGFSHENYETLALRCALYGQRLLKKADQCRAIYLASHLWLATELAGRDSEDAVLFRDDSKVLETLQRATRVADACMDVSLSVELFVEILNQYLYFLDHDVQDVTINHVNSLIELIKSNAVKDDDNDKASLAPREFFTRTLNYIKSQTENISAFSKLDVEPLA